MSGIASGFETFFATTYNEILAILRWPAIICFAIAVGTWIFSSNPQSVEKGKSWALRIAIALILAHIAKPLVDTIIQAAKGVSF